MALAIAVRHRRRAGDRVRLSFMARFGEYDGRNGSNVTDVNRAHPRVANGRHVVPVFGDHRLKREKALEVQIRSEKREADSELSNPSLDRRMVAKKTDQRHPIAPWRGRDGTSTSELGGAGCHERLDGCCVIRLICGWSVGTR